MGGNKGKSGSNEQKNRIFYPVRKKNDCPNATKNARSDSIEHKKGKFDHVKNKKHRVVNGRKQSKNCFEGTLIVKRK